MDFGRYEIQQQISAGEDGLLMEAVCNEDQQPAEVRVLNLLEVRAKDWARAKKRLELGKLLDHAALWQVRDLQLDYDFPFVAMDPPLPHAFAEAASQLPVTNTVAFLHAMAEVLGEMHDLGLPYGPFASSEIRTDSAGKLQIDPTGLNCGVHATQADFSILDASCVPPEWTPGKQAEMAYDIYGLAALGVWLISGNSVTAEQRLQLILTPQEDSEQWQLIAKPLTELLQRMLSDDPSERPLAPEVLHKLTEIQQSLAQQDKSFVVTSEFDASTETPEAEPQTSQTLTVGQRVGRFLLVDKLGEGGMGVVFLGQDVVDETKVAIKVLSTESAKKPKLVRRFLKEARLLSEVNNPFVANLLEFNESNGIYYLVVEYIPGEDAFRLIQRRGPLPSEIALSILCDVARGLVEPHNRGIVHRDIKPENILLLKQDKQGDELVQAPRAKLTDFGIARHIEQTKSMAVTQEHSIVGSPSYMAPEQWTDGGSIDARADVYSMGATLFHLLAGRPPFEGDNVWGLATKHNTEPVPKLSKINAGIKESVAHIVERALAKDRKDRYPNAQAMLEDMERALRGEAFTMQLHPRLPEAGDQVLSAHYQLDLKSTPEQLWPYISNTNQINHAIGLPAVEYETRRNSGGGVDRFAKARLAGLTLAWQEHPYEWVENRRMSVFRDFSSGPFQWFASIVELENGPNGGTRLHHHVKIRPRGTIGKLVGMLELKFKSKQALEKTYKRIDRTLSQPVHRDAFVDPFEKAPSLSKAQQQRLERGIATLKQRGIPAHVADKLKDYVASASVQEVARIRPYQLANRLDLDKFDVLHACLHATQLGLLRLLWDILCPVCRIPSQVHDQLNLIEDHGHCNACDLDFELDFGNSIEMIFAAHPNIRSTETRVYCIGGPSHTPHIVAQVRLAPQERFVLDLNLEEGSYQLCGPQLPYRLPFQVEPNATTSMWEIPLAGQPEDDLTPPLRPGGQRIGLLNDSPHELLIRLERTASRQDAITAAYASTLGVFRELFPHEVISSGRASSLPTVTFLVSWISESSRMYYELGDAKTFDILYRAFKRMEQVIVQQRGSVFKMLAGGVQGVFDEPHAALQAALRLQHELSQTEEIGAELQLQQSIHCGPVMIATLDNRIDYFGGTINTANALARAAKPGEMILSEAVFSDPEVIATLKRESLPPRVVKARVPNGPQYSVQRIQLHTPAAS